jgi:hypothetical protein
MATVEFFLWQLSSMPVVAKGLLYRLVLDPIVIGSLVTFTNESHVFGAWDA